VKRERERQRGSGSGGVYLEEEGRVVRAAVSCTRERSGRRCEEDGRRA